MQKYNSKVKSDLRGRCYLLGLKIIKLSGEVANTTASRIIMSQVIRSGTSVGANVYEAKSASSRKDYKKYYEIALKSMNETNYWLDMLLDSELVSHSAVEDIIREGHELANMLAAGVIKLKGTYNF